jgi:hypothetical protein
MEIEKDVQTILADIFEPLLMKENIGDSPIPTFDDAVAFAKLLLTNPLEEDFQRFLVDRHHLVLRATQSGDDNTQGLLSKPPIGIFKKADFCVFRIGQGGCSIIFVEIENAIDILFNKDLTFSKKMRVARNQVDDWKQYIATSHGTVVKDLVKILKESPMYPEKSPTGSFRLREPERIEQAWNGFGGYENCYIGYYIIIGRWSKLSQEEKERLIYLNNENRANGVYIRTYEQIIRKAFDGPEFPW